MAEAIRKVKERFRKIKNKEVLLAIALGALVLVLFFTSFSGTKKSKTDDSSGLTSETYVALLETRLKSVLSEIDGAGKVEVMITVSSGIESVPYKKDDGTPVSSGGKVVVLKENYPPVVGVAVVADGASDYVVRQRILSACVSLLNVPGASVQIFPRARR